MLGLGYYEICRSSVLSVRAPLTPEPYTLCTECGTQRRRVRAKGVVPSFFVLNAGGARLVEIKELANDINVCLLPGVYRDSAYQL